MATPLRKDETQFENEDNLTTADLAKGKRPEPAEGRGPQVVGTERMAAENLRADGTPLFPSNELNDLRTR